MEVESVRDVDAFSASLGAFLNLYRLLLLLNYSLACELKLEFELQRIERRGERITLRANFKLFCASH